MVNMSYKEAKRRIRATCSMNCTNYSGTADGGFKCENHNCKLYVAMDALDKAIEHGFEIKED